LVLTLNGEPFVMPASSVDTIKLAHRSTIASLTDVFFLPDVSILDDVVLDLTDNGVAIDYTGTSNITAVANYLANNRIISSSTATNRHLRYGDNALLGVTTFGAQPVDASSILVRFTYDGDANLDGMVEGRDLYILGINWHQSGKTWVQADFNGDGYVDAADLTFISVNWQAGV
jgi:hypothetical protein